MDFREGRSPGVIGERFVDDSPGRFKGTMESKFVGDGWEARKGAPDV